MREFLIRHQTRYHYESPVMVSQNLCCLRPLDFAHQTVESIRLEIDPLPEWQLEWRDGYGNLRDAFSISTPHDCLEIRMWARVRRQLPLLPETCMPWEEARVSDRPAWRDEESVLRREFACPSPLLPARDTAAFPCDDCFPAGVDLMECLRAFTARVNEWFCYVPGSTHTFTPLEEMLTQRQGVCQDFAHAAVSELRRRGFAAGYVSGYLETLPMPGEEKLLGADATHAWFAVYAPGFGWLHFDPTNNVMAGESHVVIGWGRDYSDVTPVKGVVLGGGPHQLQVGVDVWRWPDQVPAELRG